MPNVNPDHAVRSRIHRYTPQSIATLAMLLGKSELSCRNWYIPSPVPPAMSWNRITEAT
jgi:hypothetical protein